MNIKKALRVSLALTMGMTMLFLAALTVGCTSKASITGHWVSSSASYTGAGGLQDISSDFSYIDISEDGTLNAKFGERESENGTWEIRDDSASERLAENLSIDGIEVESVLGLNFEDGEHWYGVHAKAKGVKGYALLIWSSDDSDAMVVYSKG